jgi:hypothetical protein
MKNQTLSGLRVLGTAKGSIATATTTALDFGTPNDIDLRTTDWARGCRLLLILRNTTAGTTDTTGWTVQDADDNAGSIGTPATADTSIIAGASALTGGTGDQYCVVAITPKAGRPWIRVNMTRASGTTDTTVVSAILLAVPATI